MTDRLMTDPLTLLLDSLDRSRRRTGRLMDAAGLGPRTTPSLVHAVTRGVRLHTYPSARPDGPPVVLVPAPIKRSYLWDLEPEVSVVASAIRRGLRPYLLEWTDPGPDEQGFGLDHYADQLLVAAMDAVTELTGVGPLPLAGHSLGGTLAAVGAARRPERVAALALLEAPLHFGPDAGAFAPFLAATPPAATARIAAGGVPGAFLDLVTTAAAPGEFQLERTADLLRSLADPVALGTHLRVLRWASDEFRLPERLFLDVVERLYRRDEFLSGELEVSGRRVGPRDLTAPLLTVHDPRSRVIPPRSVLPVHEAAAAADKRLLSYPGDVGVALQHVGVLVGRVAHRTLWPDIWEWLTGAR